MNRRTIIILGIVFAALLIVTLIQNYQANQTPAQDIGLERIFPEMAVLDIQAIQLRTPDEAHSFVTTRADDGTWTSPDAAQGTLNTDAATTIAQTIVLLSYQRTIQEPENLTELGFNPYGIFLIQVLMLNGEGHSIAVGGLTPTQDTYYVLVDERPDVYLVRREQLDYLMNYLLTPPVYLTTPTASATLINNGG
jgi:hypothetical protein